MKALAKLATAPVYETTESVFDGGRERPVVIELHAAFIKLRLKGTTRSYVLSHGTIFTAAVWQDVEEQRRSRKKIAALPRARVARK